MQELIHDLLEFLTGLGYWGIMIGLMIEVIPSEIVLAYAGYLVHRGEIGFTEAVVFGTIGGVIAQIFVYWIGKYGGRPFLEKFGKYILIRKHHIDVAEQWFNRYGTGVIFTARFIPVVRHAISIPAGIARMSLFRFTVLTTLAVIPWSILFIYLGIKLSELGKNWEQINEISGPYVKPLIIGAVVLTAAYVAYVLWKKRRSSQSAAAGRAEAGKRGEQNVAHQLRFIGDEYKVLNNLHVRTGNRSQEIDHLVVGPNGVFHIETKNWTGELTFDEQGLRRSQNGKDLGYTEDPTAQLYRHEYVLKKLLKDSGIEADVVGVLCFADPAVRLSGSSPAFASVKADRLVHYIMTYKAKKKLSNEDIRKITRLLGQSGRK